MYHPNVTQNRLDRLQFALRSGVDPAFSFRDVGLDEVDHAVNGLEQARDEERGLIRALTSEEEAFILHEIHRCKADFRYWASRYAWIKTKQQDLRRFQFLESQEIILDKIAAAEVAALSGKSGDGILIQLLKARQLGGSTLAEALIAHRVIFYGNTTALVGGDVPDQSAYLFDMIERIYDHMPWWMKPEETYRVKDKQIYFGKIDSLVLVESGKSSRGGESKGKGGDDKGKVGTGKTYPLVHLSELALWPSAEQLDDSLEPSIPRSPRTLVIYESTAKGRGNWWHHKWLATRDGLGRFTPVFIPWYGENRTYTRPAPVDWVPASVTLAHAKKAEEVGRRWLDRKVDLTRNQLYWWETTREDHIHRKKLHVFLAEYAADDLEAFQHSGRSVFGSQMLHELRQGVNEPSGVLEFQTRADQAIEAQEKADAAPSV